MIIESQPLEERCWTSCGDKFQFETRESARAEAIRLEYYSRFKMDVYQCKCCGWWHFGHHSTKWLQLLGVDARA